ncbi:MAG: SdpI family protein [Clostridia bacterium]|nr:SdpI family protein [Clostridia bacterium]
MIKKHMKTIIITSVITLMPMLIGIALWNKLPAEVPTHFGINNEPDGYSSKAFSVFGMPLLMLAMHIVCIFATKLDPKMGGLSSKVFTMVLYIIPAVSLLICAMIYPVALGKEMRVGLIVILFMGLLFTMLGNYLPKCKQSYTVGIKLPWTLDDSENWTKTHALAGKLWVAGGLLIIITAFLENPVIFFSIVVVMVLVPTVYSYLLFKNKRNKSE